VSLFEKERVEREEDAHDHQPARRDGDRGFDRDHRRSEPKPAEQRGLQQQHRQVQGLTINNPQCPSPTRMRSAQPSHLM
jgi:hypothetical protein